MRLEMCPAARVWGVLLVTVLPALPAAAQGTRLDSLRASYGLPPVPVERMVGAAAVRIPAASFGSPTAFGARWGDVFAGAGYQHRARRTRRGDGALTAGFGVGDPIGAVALEITATSFSTLHQGFLTNGGLSFKVHRRIGERTGVALGAENAVPWGEPDAETSVFVVASHLLPLRRDPAAAFGGVGVTVGVGNDRFQREAAVRADEAGVGLFAALSTRLTPELAATLDWTGQDLNAGLIYLPDWAPLALGAGLADITGSAGDGARFIAGGGVALRFR